MATRVLIRVAPCLSRALVAQPLRARCGAVRRWRAGPGPGRVRILKTKQGRRLFLALKWRGGGARCPREGRYSFSAFPTPTLSPSPVINTPLLRRPQPPPSASLPTHADKFVSSLRTTQQQQPAREAAAPPSPAADLAGSRRFALRIGRRPRAGTGPPPDSPSVSYDSAAFPLVFGCGSPPRRRRCGGWADPPC